MTAGALSNKFAVMNAEQSEGKGAVVSLGHGGRRVGAGRPAKVINAVELERLCRLQVTMREAAAFFGMSVSTFHDHLVRNPELAAAWERGRQAGLISLRRLQWQTAERGNIAMLIFLGKAYLGQSDQPAADETAFPGWDLERLTVAELEMLLVLQAKATTPLDVGEAAPNDLALPKLDRVPASRQLSGV